MQYEFFYRVLGQSDWQDRIWTHVLTQVAADFGVNGQVQTHKSLLDPNVQWKHAKNIFRNAGFFTILHLLGAPFRWLRDRIAPKPRG